MGQNGQGSELAVGHWAAISGRWTFERSDATFRGVDAPAAGDGGVHYGLALTDLVFRGGSVHATLQLADGASAVRIAVGYEASSGAYYSVGIGSVDPGGAAGHFAYVLDEFVPGHGWRPLVAHGVAANLEPARGYDCAIDLSGARLSFSVDGVRVIAHDLPQPIRGDQVGAVGWGSGAALTSVRASSHRPRAFVVMQYTEPYNSLYRDVIQPICDEAGLDPRRADEGYTTSIIVQDIQAEIAEADVVIAEITPVNANVFYEVGYSHARGKPTILLARRDEETPLPFDVRSYRCIFYDDAIAGKARVEEDLRRHLLAVLGRSGAG